MKKDDKKLIKVSDLQIKQQIPEFKLNIDDLFKGKDWLENLKNMFDIQQLKQKYEYIKPKLQELANQKKYPDLANAAKKCIKVYEKLMNNINELENIFSQYS